MNKTNKKRTGLNIEIFFKNIKKNNGYDSKNWSYKRCATPIYIDPNEFNHKVDLTIPSKIF